MADQQRQVFYSGDVQGVGFRFTACRIAARYDVAGYVRNLPDGRVECLIEGDGAEIDAFLRDLGESMEDYIVNQDQRTAPYSGKWRSFTIRY